MKTFITLAISNQRTIPVLFLLLILLIILDIYLYTNEGKGDTISNIIRDWVYARNYYITFAWGLLTGHLFLGSKTPLVQNSNTSLILVFSSLALLFILGRVIKKKPSVLFQLILLIGGTLFGHYIWAQN